MHKRHSQSPQYGVSPYAVSWLWHWLCCSVDPLQHCYTPAGRCNRYCCPPDPWWVLKFYSLLSWWHWLCPASVFHPSTAAENTQHIHTLYSISLPLICKLFYCVHVSCRLHHFDILQFTSWMNNYIDNNSQRSLPCSLAFGTVHYILLNSCCVGLCWFDLIAQDASAVVAPG